MIETLPHSFLSVEKQEKEKHRKTWKVSSSNQIYSVCLNFVFLPCIWPALHSTYSGALAELSYPPSGSRSCCTMSSFSTQVLAKLEAAPAGTDESSNSQHQPGEGTFPCCLPASWGEAGMGQQGWLLRSSLLKTQGWGIGGWRALAGAPLCTFSWLTLVKKPRNNIDRIMSIKTRDRWS